MRHLVRSRREILERIAERETREEIGDLDISKPTLPDCSRRPATEHVNESARGKLIRWKHKLDSLGIGYGGGNYNMRVGMPFRITSDQFERLRRRGLLYAQMFDIANRLYAESLSNPSIVTKLVEGGMMPWGVEIQHALYEIKDPVRLPLFFRADMLSLEKTVELNIPGGGLSLMHSIDLVTLKRRTFGKGLAEGWAEGLRWLSGKDCPRVAFPLHNDNVRGDVNYFARVLKGLGINPVIYSKRLPEPSEIDVLLRFDMNYAVSQKGWDKMFEAYLKGGLEIEPPPTSIYDTKIPELLAFHPATCEAFLDEIRGMFPFTYLAEPGTLVHATGGGEEQVKIEDLPKLPASKTRFVLKYAGPRSEIYAGSMAVFKLDGSRHGDQGSENLLKRALSDYTEKSEPWIIQERLREDFDVTYLQGKQVHTEKMRARITPYYRLWQGQSDIIGGGAVFSTKWKVHGQPDSVQCAITVD